MVKVSFRGAEHQGRDGMGLLRWEMSCLANVEEAEERTSDRGCLQI